MNRRMLAVALVAALGLLPAIGAGAEEIKIGIVDLQRALNESRAGKRAKEQFKGEFERLQDSLKREKEDLDRMKDELEKKSVVLKEEQRQSLAEEFERKRRDLRRKLEDSDQDLRKKDSELTGVILRRLADVIQEIGARDSYTIILENSASSVLYGSKSVDLTDEVIRVFDARE